MEANMSNDCKPTAHTETPPPQKIDPEKQFILAYEALPQLWDPSDMRYSSRTERFNALGQLLPIYKKVKSYATIEDVKKKINCLRSNFRRELKKYIASENSGAGPKVSYYPKVWYFPYLSFLRKLEHSDGELMYESTAESEETESIVKLEETDDITDIKRQKLNCSQERKAPSPPPPRMKRKPPREIFNTDQSSSPPCQTEHRCQGISMPIALEWAETLERLQPLQRLYAKKAINDILFEAELGNLHKHSILINDPNSYYHPSPAHTSLHSPITQPSPSQYPDRVSNEEEDTSLDIDYKIPIMLCNPENQKQDSETTKGQKDTD